MTGDKMEEEEVRENGTIKTRDARRMCGGDVGNWMRRLAVTGRGWRAVGP